MNGKGSPSSAPGPGGAMAQQLRGLALFLALGFVAIGMTTGYWALIQRADLLARPDNPRRIISERAVPRGTIFDRHGAVLAESAGPPGELERRYPYPDLAPVLGYISPFFGSAGIEAAYDDVLHGDSGYEDVELFWQGEVLGAPPPGRDVRLTIDLSLQTVADQALGERAGAVVLLDAVTGEILAMASHPTFDANDLEAQWPALVEAPTAPLLNRATLALYQPGAALWPALLAAAHQAGPINFEQAYLEATAPVQINGGSLGCRVPPRVERLTLREALHFGCPSPIAEVGQQLGPEGLAEFYRDFRLVERPVMPIAAAVAAPNLPPEDVHQAAVGQGELTVTPLHMALITAALAQGGQMPAPQLVLAAETREGRWQRVVPAGQAGQVVAPMSANEVRSLLEHGYGAVAVSGTEGQRLAWFTGFAPRDEARYAVAVLLENGDLEAAEEIGRRALEAAAGG